MKIIFLFEGNFEIAGRDRHFVKGQVEDVEPNDAARLIAGLCAEEYTEETKPEKKRKAGGIVKPGVYLTGDETPTKAGE